MKKRRSSAWKTSSNTTIARMAAPSSTKLVSTCRNAVTPGLRRAARAPPGPRAEPAPAAPIAAGYTAPPSTRRNPRRPAIAPESEKSSVLPISPDPRRTTMEVAMQPYRYHVFVCDQQKPEGVPCCSARGSRKVVDALRGEVAAQGLADEVQITPCGSLGLCERGPNMVVYSEGVWYSGVSPNDVPELVRSHF